MTSRSLHSLILAVSLIGLSACGGGGGGTTPTTPPAAPPPAAPITSQTLADPTPGADNNFGSNIVILTNGNIVVTDPNDSSVAANNGAVHLYNPLTQTLIASIFGDNADDQLGSSGVTALANNNFVIASEFDGGTFKTGSVRLVNGSTGEQIGTPLSGDTVNDFLGRSGITALANNNFVIASENDDVGGMVNAGSVRLVNGATGVQIGATLAGDTRGNFLGRDGVTALANSNFVIASAFDDVGGVIDAGSVRLVDGATGAEIGTPLAGDTAFDFEGITLTASTTDNFYLVGAPRFDANGLMDSGFVWLIAP